MPNGDTQPNFDGQTPVSGYTLFRGKDGQSYYLKGEGLSDAAIASKVAAIRGTFPGVTKPNTQAPQGQEPEPGFWSGSPSVPGLPMMASQTMTPEKYQQGATTAGQTAVAGAVAGGAALGGAALLAPSVGTATVGTGVLGPEGAEITKDIATQGPSLARAGINAAVSAMKAHPVITSYVATHIANAIGIPLPKVLKAIMLIPGAAE